MQKENGKEFSSGSELTRSLFVPNSGFSLLETIVAISILMTTIVGPLALASKGIAFANYVKDEITAFYLAQEALEAIRNIRDTNIINNIPEVDGGWLAIIKNKCMTSGGGSAPCRIDIWNYNQVPDHGLVTCPAGDCGVMKVLELPDNSGSIERLYGYDDMPSTMIPLGVSLPLPDSIFSRKIIITKVDYSNLTSQQQIDANLGSLSDINEINVKIEVAWYRGNIERSIQISENLFSI